MGIHARPKEILDVADLHDDRFVRGFHLACARLGRRPTHLYAVLRAAQIMRILGMSAFYHDSAAALIVDGEIVAAELD